MNVDPGAAARTGGGRAPRHPSEPSTRGNAGRTLSVRKGVPLIRLTLALAAVLSTLTACASRRSAATAPIAAPLFVYQGENDPRVRRSESDSIVKAVRRNGRPVEYMIAKDEGHSLDRRENQIEFFSRTARFLEEHLR